MLKVRKRTLVLIAGFVWFAAGFNILRIGVVTYDGLWSALNLALSLAVFVPFGMMFYGMVKKHVRRIKSYADKKHIVFKFFDIKSYIIMAAMMTGGISLRVFNLCPDIFIAVFYTGLGCALSLAGVVFICKFFAFERVKA